MVPGVEAIKVTHLIIPCITGRSLLEWCHNISFKTKGEGTMRSITVISLISALIFIASSSLHAHCEIPCGIYDDATRIVLLREHIDTIEKSMKAVRAISAEETIDYNQLVRWIDNKEAHADELQHIVTQYFMTQRIKPAAGDAEDRAGYIAQLTVLHEMLIAAMKAKQSVDLQHVEKLRELVDRFEKLYMK